jgi:hypothetical protein
MGRQEFAPRSKTITWKGRFALPDNLPIKSTFYQGSPKPMNTQPANSNNHKAVEKVRNELHKLYREVVGKEPNPDVLWADAKNFVAKCGPDTNLLRSFVLKISGPASPETSQNRPR